MSRSERETNHRQASEKHVGRPRAVLNRLRIDQLRVWGLSWREVARRMDLPRSTVYRCATV